LKFKDDQLKFKEASEQTALAKYKECIEKTRRFWAKKNPNQHFNAENLYFEGDWLVDIVPIGRIHLNFSHTSEFVIKMPENTVAPYMANPDYPLSNLEMREVTFNEVSNSKDAGTNLRSYQKFLMGAVSIYDDENSYITLQIEAFEAIKKGMEDDGANIRWEFLKPIVSKKIRVSRLEHSRWGYLQNNVKVKTLRIEKNAGIPDAITLALMFPNADDIIIKIQYSQLLSEGEYIPLRKIELKFLKNSFYGLIPQTVVAPILTERNYVTFRQYKSDGAFGKHKGWLQVYDIRTADVVKKQEALDKENIIRTTTGKEFERLGLGLGKLYNIPDGPFTKETRELRNTTLSNVTPFAVREIPSIKTFEIFEHVTNIDMPNEFMLILMDYYHNLYALR
jgi:hypothetical protein